MYEGLKTIFPIVDDTAEWQANIESVLQERSVKTFAGNNGAAYSCHGFSADCFTIDGKKRVLLWLCDDYERVSKELSDECKEYALRN